jgi:ABC-type antimicrobial peptide transport system permease subunit
MSLDEIIANRTAPARFRTMLMAAFALIGIAVASIGLYGLVAYAVSQRTAEIGTRVALGAGTRDVMALVLGEGVAVAAVGVAIGLPAAYATSRALATLLFGVTPSDPWTYVGAAAGLMAVALAASYVPARRAARIDPVVALRSE